MGQVADTKPWEDFAASSSKPWEDFKPKDTYNAIDGLRKGAGSVLSGYGRTIDALAGEGSGSADVLEGAGSQIAGDNQQSAFDVVKDGKRSLLDRAKAVPYAVLESSPGLAADLAVGQLGAGMGAGIGALGGPVGAGIGGAVGGALGFGVNYAARTFGDNAYRRAASRSDGVPVQPTTEDKLYAAADSGVGALLSRVGAKVSLGSAGPLAGRSLLEVAPQVGKQVVKGVTVDAATSAGQNAADQAILDGKVDPQEVLGAAAVGGATGGALGASKVPAKINGALKFRDIDPQFGDRVASRFDGLDTSNPKKSFQAIDSVQTDLNTEIGTRRTALNSAINDHVEASGGVSDLPEHLNKIQTRLGKGEVVPDDSLQTARDAIGDTRQGARYVESLEDQNTLNRIKQAGNYNPKLGTFGGGITGTDFGQKYLNPLGKFGRLGDASLALQGAMGMHIPGLPYIGGMHFIDPVTATSLAAGHMGLYGAAKAIDSTLGNTNPLGTFRSQFGSPKASLGAAAAPAYPSENLPTIQQKIAAIKLKASDGQKVKESPSEGRGPQEGPRQASPQGESQDPSSFQIATPHGTRTQLDSDVRLQRDNVDSGTKVRTGTRDRLFDATKSLPISREGHEYLKANRSKILTDVFHNAKSRADARGLMEHYLNGMSREDADAVRNHLENTSDTQNGMSFYLTWKKHK